MMRAPAPVDARKTVTGPAIRKRTGLLGMRVGSDHAITLNRGTPAEQTIHVRARSSEETMGVSTHYVCLHEKCAGKQWPSLVAMYAAHPAPSEMAKRDEAHVFGLWSDEPLDPAEVAKAEEALKRAEAVMDRAKERTAAAKGWREKEDAEKHENDARAGLEKAQAGLAAAQAPIGLIAPPEPRVEEV